MSQIIIVLAGPSGVGKTTAKNHLLSIFPQLAFSVSTTTRLQMAHELDTVDYNFVGFREFESMIQNGELVEWQQVYGGVDSRYGTTRAELERISNEGKIPLLDIDVHGAINVKKIYGERACIIMVQPPTIQELERRLRERKRGESEVRLRERLAKAESELALAPHFDAVLVNDDMEKFLAEVTSVIARAIDIISVSQ